MCHVVPFHQAIICAHTHTHTHTLSTLVSQQLLQSSPLFSCCVVTGLLILTDLCGSVPLYLAQCCRLCYQHRVTLSKSNRVYLCGFHWKGFVLKFLSYGNICLCLGGSFFVLCHIGNVSVPLKMVYELRNREKICHMKNTEVWDYINSWHFLTL